jgi:cell division protein FtsL
MVQASQARKAEFDHSYGYSAGQAPAVKKVRKVYKKSAPGKRTLIKVGIAAFAYAIILVYLCVTVSNMGYKMVNLEKDIAKLQDANHMLEFKIAEQVSLDRVEMVATKQLGMCKLDSSRAIAVTAGQPAKIQTADQKVAGDKGDNKNVAARSLQKLYSNLMLLAEKR